jgi:hypothetical protein
MIKKIVVQHVTQKLSEWYKQNLTGYLSSLPDNAQASACIDKINRGYVGVIDIEISQTHFMAKAIKKDPCELISTLLNDIYRQMNDLKSGRYFAS